VGTPGFPFLTGCSLLCLQKKQGLAFGEIKVIIPKSYAMILQTLRFAQGDNE